MTQSYGDVFEVSKFIENIFLAPRLAAITECANLLL